MKWLITGAHGQLGRTLSEFLIENDFNVFALGRDSLDISDSILVNSVINQINPDIVVNCAAWTDVDGAESNKAAALSINASGAQYLAKAVSVNGARLIHISTDFVFGEKVQDEYLENDKCCPVNYYGESKAVGESLVSSESPEAIILRASWLYSSYGRNFAKSIVRKLLSNAESISVVDDQVGQPTSCLSLSRTILAIASSQNAVGIFHGSSLGEVSRFGFAQAIAEEIGEDSERILPIKSDSLVEQLSVKPNRTVLGHTRNLEARISLPMEWRADLKNHATAIRRQIELDS